jgi:hypothetical protein
VYSVFATNAQAKVLRTIIFVEKATQPMREAATTLGLSVVVSTAMLEPPKKPRWHICLADN